jgi:hypothetical protein
MPVRKNVSEKKNWERIWATLEHQKQNGGTTALHL